MPKFLAVSFMSSETIHQVVPDNRKSGFIGIGVGVSVGVGSGVNVGVTLAVGSGVYVAVGRGVANAASYTCCTARPPQVN